MADKNSQVLWRIFLTVMQGLVVALVMKGINDIGDVRERVARIEGRLDVMAKRGEVNLLVAPGESPQLSHE